MIFRGIFLRLFSVFFEVRWALWARGAHGAVGPVGPWAQKLALKSTIPGNPLLNFGPEGYNSRKPIFENRSRKLQFQETHF